MALGCGCPGSDSLLQMVQAHPPLGQCQGHLFGASISSIFLACAASRSATVSGLVSSSSCSTITSSSTIHPASSSSSALICLRLLWLTSACFVWDPPSSVKEELYMEASDWNRKFCNETSKRTHLVSQSTWDSVPCSIFLATLSSASTSCGWPLIDQSHSQVHLERNAGRAILFEVTRSLKG